MISKAGADVVRTIILVVNVSTAEKFLPKYDASSYKVSVNRRCRHLPD